MTDQRERSWQQEDDSDAAAYEGTRSDVGVSGGTEAPGVGGGLSSRAVDDTISAPDAATQVEGSGHTGVGADRAEADPAHRRGASAAPGGGRSADDGSTSATRDLRTTTPDVAGSAQRGGDGDERLAPQVDPLG